MTLSNIESQYSAIPISERDKIHGFFNTMKDLEIFDIEKVKPENREKFIAICKYQRKWNREKFIISLNREETKIKKFEVKLSCSLKIVPPLKILSEGK